MHIGYGFGCGPDQACHITFLPYCCCAKYMGKCEIITVIDRYRASLVRVSQMCVYVHLFRATTDVFPTTDTCMPYGYKL